MALQADADTLILYDFNADLPEGGGHDTVQSQVGSYPMTPSGDIGERIVGGPGTRKYARSFGELSGNGTRLDGTPDATMNANLNGDFTMECWVWIWSYDFTNGLFGVHDNGTQTNYSFIARISRTTGEIEVFWEDSGGANITITPGTIAVPTEQWVHIAIRKEDTGSGTDRVSAFVNGTKASTTATPNFGDGNGGELWIGGADYFGGRLTGRMAGMRFTTTLLSDSTIQAHAADTTDYELPSDAGDWARWEMDEPPDVEDKGSLKIHLQDMSFNGRPGDWQPSPMVDLRDSRALFIPNDFMEGPPAPEVADAFHNQNPLTLEWWLRWPNGTGVGLLYLIQSGEAEEENLLALHLDNANDWLEILAEHGGGINDQTNTAALAEKYALQYLAVRKVPKGSGLVDYEVYVNGSHYETISGATEVTGGSSTLLRLGDSNNPSGGIFGSFRASSKLRTPTEISDEWDAGTTPVTPTPPSPSFIVTAIEPLNSGIISSGTPLEVDVEQVVDGPLDPNQVTIVLNDTETIYSGGTFLGEFTSSSVSDTGGGVYRFTLVKDTSWTAGTFQNIRFYLPGESP